MEISSIEQLPHEPHIQYLHHISKGNRCKIEITGKGLEISGNCAQGLLDVLVSVYNRSKEVNSEIFSCACVDPDTSEVEKAIISNIGSPTSVTTEGIERVCPEDTLQISYHTHPVSGEAKFSSEDGSVIVNRFNKGYDDEHCVVGEKKVRRVLQTRLRKKQKV